MCGSDVPLHSQGLLACSRGMVMQKLLWGPGLLQLRTGLLLLLVLARQLLTLMLMREQLRVMYWGRAAGPPVGDAGTRQSCDTARMYALDCRW